MFSMEIENVSGKIENKLDVYLTIVLQMQGDSLPKMFSFIDGTDVCER